MYTYIKMLFNKFSWITTIIFILVIELSCLGIFVLGFSNFRQPIGMLLFAALVLFLNYLIYWDLFKNSYEIYLKEDIIELSPWGNVLFNIKNKKTEISVTDIKDIVVYQYGLEFAQGIFLTLKNGRVIRIGWNFFKQKEFQNLYSTLKNIQVQNAISS